MTEEPSNQRWKVVFVAPAKGDHPTLDSAFITLAESDDLELTEKSGFAGAAQYTATVKADSHESAQATVEAVLGEIDGATGVLSVSGPLA